MTVDDIIQLLLNSPYATGIDISKWQDTFDIDLVDLDMALQVLDFVMLRAGYGSTDGRAYIDPKFKEFWQELEQHPSIVRGVYWYFSSHVPWEVQRDKLFSIVQGLNFDYWELDFERYYNVKSAGFALTAIRMLKAMKIKYPTKRVLLYTNRPAYTDWLKPFTNECDQWPLHHAQYPWANWYSVTEYFLNWWQGVFATLTKKPTLPPSRNGAWEIWQVGDKTRLAKALGVGGTNLDINISRRKRSAFIEWVGKPDRWVDDGDPPDEEPGGCCNALLDSAIAFIEGLKE